MVPTNSMVYVTETESTNAIKRGVNQVSLMLFFDTMFIVIDSQSGGAKIVDSPIFLLLMLRTKISSLH